MPIGQLHVYAYWTIRPHIPMPIGQLDLTLPMPIGQLDHTWNMPVQFGILT